MDASCVADMKKNKKKGEGKKRLKRTPAIEINYVRKRTALNAVKSTRQMNKVKQNALTLSVKTLRVHLHDQLGALSACTRVMHNV